MKKKIIVPIIYFIVLTTYIAVSLLSFSPKTVNYWIGFGCTIFSLLISMFVLFESEDIKSSSFPISISICVFSIIYVLATLACNFLFGGVDQYGKQLVETRTFIIYEILCFTVFIVILIVLLVVKSTVKENNDKTNFAINKVDSITNRIILAMNKVKNFNNSSDLIRNFELLLEDIKFSNFGGDSEIEKSDFEIGMLLDRLDADIENIININSDDYSSIIDTILAIRSKIKERNIAINSNNSHI